MALKLKLLSLALLFINSTTWSKNHHFKNRKPSSHCESTSSASTFDDLLEVVASMPKVPPLGLIQAREKIEQLWSQSQEKIAREVRPDDNKTSADAILTDYTCGPANRSFLKVLEAAGFKPKLVQSKTHIFLTLQVNDNGQKRDLLIDASYRQVFFKDKRLEYRDVYDPRAKRAKQFKKERMPHLLVVPMNEAKQKLEEFPLNPYWKLPNEEPFEVYYKPIKRLN